MVLPRRALFLFVSASKILEYSILGVSHEFEIGSVSGVIQTKQKLISNLRYLLYVQAQDTGLPPEVSEYGILITLFTSCNLLKKKTSLG